LDLSKFCPPRCPNRSCEHHLHPQGRFWHRHGAYAVACRDHLIPRYRCRSCRKTFGYQTFRADYHDQRPDLNPKLVQAATSGVSLRRFSLEHCVTISAVQRKFRKLGGHAACLQQNLVPTFPSGRTVVMDELETYETDSIQTLTVPVLVDQRSGLIVEHDVAPIRRLARKGSPRRRKQDAHERKHGKRKDMSRAAMRGVLQRFAERLQGGSAVLLTDEKEMYAALVKRIFGDRIEHRTTPGAAKRDHFNPLFPINHTFARLRDIGSRLHRRSWCVSKKGQYLKTQLALLQVYRNFVRRRTNVESVHRTPAWHMGILPRHLSYEEVCSWRQDWGLVSSHPLSLDGRRTVAA
jgi:transposase-like protein